MGRSNVFAKDTILSPRQRVWASFRNNKLAMAGLWIFIGFCILAIGAPVIAPYSIDYQSPMLMQPPSWSDDGLVDYFFGTDDLGRDLLSLLIYGARQSFGYAIMAVFAAFCIGFPLGILAGMTRGIKSSILHHLMDTILSIPSLLLAIIVVSITGPGLENTLLAITLALIPKFIRSTYNAVSEQMTKEYILAVRLDGGTHLRILKYGIIPNILDAIVAQTARALSAAILDITALGFIGIGAQPPQPEWGALLGSTRDLLFVAPWTVTLPGFTIIASILSINLVGEGLRSSLMEGTD
jgi:cationic peptide transport system permease protein